MAYLSVPSTSCQTSRSGFSRILCSQRKQSYNYSKKSPGQKDVSKPSLRRAKWWPFDLPSPSHLDGKYPGDAGFDPLRLGMEPASLRRNREIEVLSARWAMIGVAGLVVPDLLGAPLYLLPDLIKSERLFATTLTFLVCIAFFEAYRAASLRSETDLERRIYPGRTPLRLRVANFFRRLRRPGIGASNSSADSNSSGSGDPRSSPWSPPGLGVWSAWLGGLPGWLSGGWGLERGGTMSERELGELKEREIGSGRLAMVAFVGVYAASMVTGKGPVENLYDVLSSLQHQAPWPPPVLQQQ